MECCPLDDDEIAKKYANSELLLDHGCHCAPKARLGGYLDKYTLGGDTYIRMLDKQIEKKSLHHANLMRGQITGFVVGFRTKEYFHSLL